MSAFSSSSVFLHCVTAGIASHQMVSEAHSVRMAKLTHLIYLETTKHFSVKREEGQRGDGRINIDRDKKTDGETYQCINKKQGMP